MSEIEDFKVGDKVVVVRGDRGCLPVGSEYCIIRVVSEHLYINDDKFFAWSKDRFRKVEESELARLTPPDSAKNIR